MSEEAEVPDPLKVLRVRPRVPTPTYRVVRWEPGVRVPRVSYVDTVGYQGWYLATPGLFIRLTGGEYLTLDDQDRATGVLSTHDFEEHWEVVE